MNYLAPERAVRLCVVERKCDGELLGLFPFTIDRGYARLPLRYARVWKHYHCFNGAPLIRRGRTVEFYTSLFSWLDSGAEAIRFLRFVFHPLDVSADQVMYRVCRSQRQSRLTQRTFERAVLMRGSDFEGHMKTVFSGKTRRNLKRQGRRLAELGAKFETLPVDDTTIDRFVALEAAGWKGELPNGVTIAQNPADNAFFREALNAGAALDAVSCLALTLDQNPVAMLFSLRAGDHLSAFKTSYDETWSAYSPGVQLFIEATRRMLDDSSIRMFDSCARPRHPVLDTLWPQRLTIGQVNVSASGVVDKTLLAVAAQLGRVRRGR